MKTRPLLSLAILLGGLALLVWQVRQVGLDVVLRGLSAVGWGFTGILLLSLLRFAARSLAWTALLREPVTVSRATAATIAGDALGNLTPLSLLASEPTKALFLGRGVPSSRALAALTAENFFYSVSVAIYIVVGTTAMLELFPLPDPVRLAGFVALGVMAVVLAAAGWMAWQQPAAVSAIVSRLPIPKLAALVDRVREFEVDTYGSVGRQTGRLGVVIFAETVFHALSFLEAWFILFLLTGQSSPLEAFVLDTFSRVSNIAFRVIPLQLGVNQAGSEIVARAIGVASGIGTTFSLVRTGRVMVWAAVGLVLLGFRKD